jgi:hypothetical protein
MTRTTGRCGTAKPRSGARRKIPVYPTLGNHDLHGSEKIALANYFERFPDLKNSVYYSVRAANTLLLVLDSALDETSGPQGQWLKQELDQPSQRRGLRVPRAASSPLHKLIG